MCKFRVNCEDPRIIAVWSDFCLVVTGIRPKLTFERSIFPYWTVRDACVALNIQGGLALCMRS